jgi:putative tryptophan/tyrosine transport system substrate-binding protein
MPSWAYCAVRPTESPRNAGRMDTYGDPCSEYDRQRRGRGSRLKCASLDTGPHPGVAFVRRRDFITLVGGAAVWPVAARAQQAAMPVVGFLISGGQTENSDKNFDAFRRGMSEAGYVDGRNVTIEYHYAEGQYERLPGMAADLVRRQVAVIATSGGNPSPLAAKAATTTIPIVFASGTDPVKSGLVASLNRPGGNITGVSILNLEIGPKRLELLHELIPAARVIGLLVNPANPSAEPQSSDLQAAVRKFGLELHVLHASTDQDIEAVFASLAQLKASALIIGADPFLTSRAEQLGALTVRHAVPAIFLYRDFAAAGGLMSYGPSLPDAYHHAGSYIGRILKGEKPGDLPVIQSQVFELIVNTKTAKAFGITLPLSLLASADEVIE